MPKQNLPKSEKSTRWTGDDKEVEKVAAAEEGEEGEEVATEVATEGGEEEEIGDSFCPITSACWTASAKRRKPLTRIIQQAALATPAIGTEKMPAIRRTVRRSVETGLHPVMVSCEKRERRRKEEEKKKRRERKRDRENSRRRREE
jgi:hypothetical protein